MPLSCHWWAILHHPLPVHCLWYRRRVGWLGRWLLLRSLSEYQLSAEESECSGGLVQLHVHLLCLEHHNHHYIWVPIALYPVLLMPNKVICSLLFAWWTKLFGDIISNQNFLCWDDVHTCRCPLSLMQICRRAWYLFSHEHDVYNRKGSELSE